MIRILMMSSGEWHFQMPGFKLWTLIHAEKR